MNQRERAKYIALVDFEYKMPIGVGIIKMSYKKDDTMFLRVYGKMAIDLLNKGYIGRLYS